ncbi:MAG: type II toxin-antitoxin system VapC family toxin [Thermosynechococcaceae cyanobacterium]
MIAVDTNVIVRFLIQDDDFQYQQSLQLFEQEELFIPDTVLLETEWVLRFAYGFSDSTVAGAFRKLLGLANIHVENGLKIAKAIDWHEQGLDFADAFHLASSEHLAKLVTFDQQFIKRAKEKCDCQVRQP